jgi:hypothetical protein
LDASLTLIIVGVSVETRLNLGRLTKCLQNALLCVTYLNLGNATREIAFEVEARFIHLGFG